MNMVTEQKFRTLARESGIEQKIVDAIVEMDNHFETMELIKRRNLEIAESRSGRGEHD